MGEGKVGVRGKKLLAGHQLATVLDTPSSQRWGYPRGYHIGIKKRPVPSGRRSFGREVLQPATGTGGNAAEGDPRRKLPSEQEIGGGGPQNSAPAVAPGKLAQTRKNQSCVCCVRTATVAVGNHWRI